MEAAAIMATRAGDLESRVLMSEHRDEAQRVYLAALAGGLSPSEALRKAARPLKAGSRARVQWLAELGASAQELV